MMRKQLLLIAMMLLPVAVCADDSGVCGENLTYTFSERLATLTIKGIGPMYNYGYYAEGVGESPWRSYIKSIKNVTIEDGVTTIGNSAFEYGENINSVSIPESVTSIGQQAFYNCQKLKSVDLKEGLQTIEEGAFLYGGLTSVSIPNSVKRIENGAFGGCVYLASITIPNTLEYLGTAFGGTSWYNSQREGMVYLGNWFYQYKTYSGRSKETRISIKEGTVGIASNAFKEIPNIASITIPDGVKSIGDGAFYGCVSLNSMEFPNGITQIGNELFYNCKNLTSVTIPNSVISIGDNSFWNCAGLVTLSLPSGLESIGDYAFACSGLQTISIPGISSVGVGALQGCSALTSVILGEGMKNISNHMFEKCSALTFLAIPNSVTTIGQNAFWMCEGLLSIVLGSGLQDIGEDAFLYSGITDLYCYAESVPTVGNHAFYMGESKIFYSMYGATLHVPAVSLEAYQTTRPWSLFSTIVPLVGGDPTPEGISQLASDTNAVECYFTIDGKRVSQPQRGLNIVRMSDGGTKKVIVK